MDLFTFAELKRKASGESLRDQGIENVTRAKWMESAIATFTHHCDELPEYFIGEDIREVILSHMEPPHHPNAWGALTLQLIKSNLIFETGRIVKMRSPSSHARRSPEYQLGI